MSDLYGNDRRDRAVTRRGMLRGGMGLAGASLLGASSLSTLAGCGPSPRGGGGPMSFWQFYAPAPGGEGSPPAGQSQWFIKLVEAWNRDREEKIRLQYLPAPDYISGPKLATAFASKQGPDVFLVSPGDFLRYYNGGVLADLAPYVDDQARQDFFPEVLATRTVGKGIHAIPMEVEPMAMFYSVKAFEDAGLSEADIPQTWDQLLDVAAKLKTKKRFGVLFEAEPGYYQNFTWYPFMWQGGGNVVDTATKKATFSSPATVQALDFWRTTINEGLAPREAQGNGGGDPIANLAAGFCAIQNVGIWAVSALANLAPDFKYGVFRLPVPNGGKYTTDLGGWAFAANAQGKNPKAAGEFIAWAIASMRQESIERGVEWIIKAKSDIGPRKSVMDLATQRGGFASGAMKKFREEIFPGGTAEPRYPPDIYRAVSDAIQACQLKNASPQQEADKAHERIQSFLAGYQGPL